MKRIPLIRYRRHKISSAVLPGTSQPGLPPHPASQLKLHPLTIVLSSVSISRFLALYHLPYNTLILTIFSLQKGEFRNSPILPCFFSVSVGSFFSSFIYLYIIGEKSIWIYGCIKIENSMNIEKDRDKKIKNKE